MSLSLGRHCLLPELGGGEAEHLSNPRGWSKLALSTLAQPETLLDAAQGGAAKACGPHCHRRAAPTLRQGSEEAFGFEEALRLSALWKALCLLPSSSSGPPCRLILALLHSAPAMLSRALSTVWGALSGHSGGSQALGTRKQNKFCPHHS